jgi:glutathione S-transferase
MEKLILHEDPVSGNCYKVRLTAAHLGLPLETRSYDITKGETRTADFLARINMNGRIPVLQVGERMIPESNAACFFLADGSPLIPPDRFDRADMLRWMFFEQYSHEPNIATLRFWLAVLGAHALGEAQRSQLKAKRDAGIAALAVMDRHLAERGFFVGDRLSLADIALFAYTHVAPEGGFDLAPYRHVRAWIDRVGAEPGHVAMAA